MRAAISVFWFCLQAMLIKIRTFVLYTGVLYMYSTKCHEVITCNIPQSDVLIGCREMIFVLYGCPVSACFDFQLQISRSFIQDGAFSYTPFLLSWTRIYWLAEVCSDLQHIVHAVIVLLVQFLAWIVRKEATKRQGKPYSVGTRTGTIEFYCKPVWTACKTDSILFYRFQICLQFLLARSTSRNSPTQ